MHGAVIVCHLLTLIPRSPLASEQSVVAGGVVDGASRASVVVGTCVAGGAVVDVGGAVVDAGGAVVDVGGAVVDVGAAFVG